MADRTYGDLKFMSHLKLPQFFASIMEICTSWDGTPAFDYYSCVAYKVMTNDPRDNIISDAGSLKALTAQVHLFGNKGWSRDKWHILSKEEGLLLTQSTRELKRLKRYYYERSTENKGEEKENSASSDENVKKRQAVVKW